MIGDQLRLLGYSYDSCYCCAVPGHFRGYNNYRWRVQHFCGCTGEQEKASASKKTITQQRPHEAATRAAGLIWPLHIRAPVALSLLLQTVNLLHLVWCCKNMPNSRNSKRFGPKGVCSAILLNTRNAIKNKSEHRRRRLSVGKTVVFCSCSKVWAANPVLHNHYKNGSSFNSN